MRLLRRYLFNTILISTLMVLMVMCALDALSTLISETEDIRKNYDLAEVGIYTLLTIPISINKYIPFATLVGALVGLGSLAATSELVAMRAAGVSLLRITWFVIRPILLLIIVSVLLAEYIVPIADQYAENRRSIKMSGERAALSSRGGLWNREGDEFMHFNTVEANGKLFGVTRYRFNNQQELVSASYAESAIFVGGRWQEENVIESRLNQGSVEQVTFPVRIWPIDLSPSLLAILVQESDNLSITRLYQYVNYLKQQNIDSGRYQLSFWNKVLQPLAIISLVLIAVSFIFGPLREVTMGYRIFSGVIVGIIFQLSQRLLGPTSLVYGFPPIVAVLLPIVVCAFIGLILLSRNR